MSVLNNNANFTNKTKLIDDLLNQITLQKSEYYKKMCKYKKIDDLSEAIIIGTGAISTSTITIGLSIVEPITLIVGAVCSGISCVLYTIKHIIDIREQTESYKTTYNQLSNLEREVRTIMVQTHTHSSEYMKILNDINIKLSLIQDSALPIKIKINK
jgi:uncharacterized protein YfcZ (UPF0381/DUF406 family)